MPERPIPLLGDISLSFVQRIEHSSRGGCIETPIPGLSGDLQERSGRPSHMIRIRGLLFGEEAVVELESVQLSAEEGEELTFSADILTALDIQKVVIKSFRVQEHAAMVNRYEYEIVLSESPPLPPPVEFPGFGGLDDFGLGDLGFDTDILGDLTDLAGDIAGALDDALGVLDQLGALANLDGLSVDGVLQPMQDVSNNVSGIGSSFKGALDNLSNLLGQ